MKLKLLTIFFLFFIRIHPSAHIIESLKEYPLDSKLKMLGAGGIFIGVLLLKKQINKTLQQKKCILIEEKYSLNIKHKLKAIYLAQQVINNSLNNYKIMLPIIVSLIYRKEIIEKSFLLKLFLIDLSIDLSIDICHDLIIKNFSNKMILNNTIEINTSVLRPSLILLIVLIKYFLSNTLPEEYAILLSETYSIKFILGYIPFIFF